MYSSSVFYIFLAAVAWAVPAPRDTSDAYISQFYDLLAEASSNQAAFLDASYNSTCSSENMVVRQSWLSMNETDRKAYTDAVLCLQTLPANTPSDLVPGAKTRYDDFVAAHINQTLTIHETGNFLSWHRWFVYTYEQALKTECGYNGSQPYWNWGLTQDDPASSTIFDGSDYSMGGNGEYIAGRGDLVLSLNGNNTVYLPAGSGGGCVTSGPFKDMVVNLGPVSLPINNGSTISSSNGGLDWNPRCLARDVTTEANSGYANSTAMINLLTTPDDIGTFQDVMQGALGTTDLGVHGGGHYTIGGNPADDVYVSPGDPVFFLHHGMIDLMWWLWQFLDIENRQYVISGTRTFENSPASDNATLDDIVDLGYAGGYPITIHRQKSERLAGSGDGTQTLLASGN
ncbi:putative Tyrosinase copper-binding domain-containing protein [Seiridium unicorne]|uniref:Tyrosinase copper-binding domain-containing protein n=1 Tax=Seiridium unicorne TaxID=138068 RepID=A0ABR2UF09_9PEZI